MWVILHRRNHQAASSAEGNDELKYSISKHHVKIIGFDEFEFGLIKRRLLEGQSEGSR